MGTESSIRSANDYYKTLFQIGTALSGSFLEFYDFGLTGALADILGENFFPDSNEDLQLIQSFTVYGAGFIFRIIGGAVLGKYGDQNGR